MLLLLTITVLAACALPRRAEARPPAPAVRYHVKVPAPHRQYVHVAMEVDAPGRAPTSVAMPAWTPGSYLVRDHAKHVYRVRAEDRRGHALDVEKLDKQTWRVNHGGRDFTLRYEVFAAEASVRTSHVDDTHASLIGTSVFMYVVGELGRPASVKVALPEGWSAYTALDSISGAAAGEAWFSAADYDALVDAPIELGTPQVRRFTVDTTQYEYVVTGAEGTGIDIDRLATDAKTVVTAQAALMEGLPMSRYVFLLRTSPTGGGGLEHRASTSMMMRRGAFDTDSGYRNAARLAAHEHFHLWNVKRLHDRALGPFDYGRENHSRLLWFHEGFTETMEALGLLRAGLVSPADHLKSLGNRWTRYLAKPGRNKDPIAQFSFDAWTTAYKPAANHPNVAISYYEKGDFVGVALDLELRLRAQTHDREGSLSGLFVRLMATHGNAGYGLSLDDIVAAASAEAGEDMAWFFERYVEGTEELPIPALLERIGVKVKTSASWLDDDGTRRNPLSRAQRGDWVYSGLSLSSSATVRNVIPRSPADDAGIMRGDELVAVDGLRADTAATAQARISAHDPGQSVTLSLYRAGRLIQRSLVVGENPHRTYGFSLVPAEELTPEVRALRDAWLATAGPTPPS